jgi:hypothetical protein
MATSYPTLLHTTSFDYSLVCFGTVIAPSCVLPCRSRRLWLFRLSLLAADATVVVAAIAFASVFVLIDCNLVAAGR